MREAEPIATASAADLALIREAATEAGRIAMGYFRKSPDVWLKDGRSPVSEADVAVDRFLREELTGARPDYGWLSEETADTPGRLAARRTFVVDPIDGTRAFVEGRSTWCVSVAVVEDGIAIAGVLDCPARGEVFWSRAGAGAFLDGEPIRVYSGERAPLVGGAKALIEQVPQPLRGRLVATPYVPSLAYRIAMLASGKLDASFVKGNSHDWDLAAADLILREAGGRILDERGRQPRYAEPVVSHGALVAGSGPLLEELAKVIASGPA